MESLTGDSKAYNTENNAVSSCSLFRCCNVITEDNTDTPENQLTLTTDNNGDENSNALKIEVDALKRRVEEAEEKINILTKEKSEAKETINTLTKEKFEAQEIAKGHKLKVETLETEIAKLREELSKKVSL